MILSEYFYMVVDEPSEFQGNHEEADTLMAYHAYRMGGRVIIRASDTDVLVILIALAAKMPETSMIVMDFGSANNRRLINVTDISRELENKQNGLSEALIGFHAVTGCDFTSALCEKGKSTPFSYLEKDRKHVVALRSLCCNVIDKPAVTTYICRIHGFNTLSNINEARYQSFIKMTGGKKIGDRVKKMSCSSLPPCEKSLLQHLLRANYVSMVCRLAQKVCTHSISDGLMMVMDTMSHFGLRESLYQTLSPLTKITIKEVYLQITPKWFLVRGWIHMTWMYPLMKGTKMMTLILKSSILMKLNLIVNHGVMTVRVTVRMMIRHTN